ncbi:hypothetical protein FRB98_009501 [Tulasnella sp. 332]|nr:hypothetical protein FRB98_009501 [Tulasnella sp. 332]
MKIIQVDDDRTIHIVKSHEEVEQLKLRRSESGLGLGDFDWHLHGSSGHIESLKQAAEHHARKQEVLRARHPETFAELDNVQRDFDHLSKELAKLTSRPVELEANFSRFGYAAHIRTHKSRADSDEEGENMGKMNMENEKGVETPGGNDTPPIKEMCMVAGRKRKKNRVTMKVNVSWRLKGVFGAVADKRLCGRQLYKTPVLRQYFYQGVLWRAENSEEVASFELFIDLLYVGIIAVIGDKATEDPTGTGLLRFCVTFIPSWRIWSDVSDLISRFETDDTYQRVNILFILVCLLGYTSNITAAFWSTYSQLIAFYIAAQVFFAITYLRMARILPHVRPIMTTFSIQFMISVVLWLGSCFIQPRDGRLGLIWVAVAWDILGGSKVLVVYAIRSPILPQGFRARMNNLFAYLPAINIEHKTERVGAFVTLVYGYSVVALLYQNQATFGMNAFFGKAVLGLIQAFCFNWIYFDVDASHLHMHAIRRHVSSASIWLATHLPFVMSFTLSGAALSKLVAAHDCGDASVDSLTDTYQAKSDMEIPDGMRWYYCGGLAIALLSMAAISACHVHTPIDTQRFRKRTRLAFRVVIATIWLCLPLAKSLNSLQLIGTTTGLTVLVLAVDVWGQSCWEDSFWCGEECKYRAKRRAMSGISAGADSERSESSTLAGDDHPTM